MSVPIAKYRALGPVCKVYRLQANLSQKQVAQHLGYNNAQVISNFERGVSGLPIKQVIKYAHLCDIPESVVIGVRLSESLYQMVEECSDEYTLKIIGLE